MPKPPEHVRHLVQRRFEQIHRDLQGRTTTGHPLIDKRFPEGLSPGTVVVLGGGPGSGKTRALLGIARRVASGGSGAALLVSRSDSRMQVVDRLLAHCAGVPARKLAGRPTVDSQDWLALPRAAGELSESELLIATGIHSIMDLALSVLDASRATRIAMVLIDDADLIEPADDAATNLCTLARHMQVPVVATVESESALRADAEHWIPLDGST